MVRQQILSLGEVLWDLFPDGPRFGGAPANFACHAAVLGGRVSMAGAVGNDSRGHEAVGVLNSYGVDTATIQVIDAAPTGTVGVELDGAGKPAFAIHEDSAWDRLAWAPRLESQLAEVEAVYFGTLGQRSEMSRSTIRRALTLAKERGILRVLDVNLRKPFFDGTMIRESVGLANVVKLSDDELQLVVKACGITEELAREEMLRKLLERYDLKLIVMTRGAAGALLVSATEVVDQVGIRTIVRDTVGAGDCFTAVVVVGLINGDPLEKIAREACERAAAVCAHSGAVPNLPFLTEHSTRT